MQCLAEYIALSLPAILFVKFCGSFCRMEQLHNSMQASSSAFKRQFVSQVAPSTLTYTLNPEPCSLLPEPYSTPHPNPDTPNPGP